MGRLLIPHKHIADAHAQQQLSKPLRRAEQLLARGLRMQHSEKPPSAMIVVALMIY